MCGSCGDKMSYKKSFGAETSNQGTLRMLNQDLQGHMLGTDEKIGKLQQQIEMLVVGMKGLVNSKYSEEEYEEEDIGGMEEQFSTSRGKGMFRNPLHAAWERERFNQKDFKLDDEYQDDRSRHRNHSDQQSLKHLKLSFPVFKEGTDTVEWLRDCEEYFTIYEVNDRRRAAIAAMHLTGVPRSWYKSYMIGQEAVSWQQFCEAFLARFGDIETDLVFDKFKRLQQTSTVEAYYDEFEKCRGQILKKIPGLTSEYFLENFVGGLQMEIKGMIRLLEPSSLEQALRLARYYEQTLGAQPKRNNSYGSYKGGQGVQNASKETTGVMNQGNTKGSSILSPSKPVETITSKPRPLTYSQREERRQKGLCFYCDDKFSKGHECKRPQTFLMVADDEVFEDYIEEPKYDEIPGENKDDWKDQELLLAALGLPASKQLKPLQFDGSYKDQALKVLVDGGSSLNLINALSFKEGDMKIETRESVQIRLPNGAVLTSSRLCTEFTWKWEDTEFTTEAWLVDLLDWDVILGIKWLSQLGDIQCNFEKQTLQFYWQDKEVILTSDSKLEIIGACNQMTTVVPLWMEQLLASYEGDEDLKEIISEAVITKAGPQQYYLINGLLQFRGKWVIGKGDLRKQVFEELHSNGVGGHSGNRATFKRVGEYFYWSSMRQDIGRWVRECAICQQVKGEHVHSPGLLKPLEIPQEPWRDIAMDFITGLPKSRGFEVIWVIVDRFSRYAHFLALSHPISAKGLAQIFFEQVYRLHGLPESIVSDRDSLFLSEFWQTLFKISGTRLNMSSAYHPQSDGSTERVNQCVEQYLRSMTCHNPKNWANWLAAAEWWYNTTFHTTLNSTPYMVVYGTKPRHIAWQTRNHSNIGTLESLLEDKQRQWMELKELLEAAQVRMKSYADSKRSERVFQKGDLVYLKLQPYRQVTVAIRKNLKLSAKYFGPYEVIEKIGPVAYRLALPATSRIHPVFHVSQLKKAVGQLKVQHQLPPVNDQGIIDLSPLRKLDTRSILRDKKVVYQQLIQWKGCGIDEATWEDEDLLQCNFPDFFRQP